MFFWVDERDVSMDMLAERDYSEDLIDEKVAENGDLDFGVDESLNG